MRLFAPTKEFKFEYSNDHPFLTTAVNQAENVIAASQKHNPHWNEKKDNPKVARQWELVVISAVKRQVANAIEKKKAYYENHLLGKITKCVLKLFAMWNNGNTAAIQTAKNFLLFWDTRAPLVLIDKGYTERMFFPFTSVSWVNKNLDTKNFFNYTPEHRIFYDNGKAFPPNKD